MSSWEIFTWTCALLLGGGSLWVFAWFLRDLPELLSRVQRGAGDSADEER